MNLREAIELALDGKALLFTGAGFSKGAKNLHNTFLKDGRQLSAHLLARCKSTEELGLENSAGLFRERFGRAALAREIEEEYTVSMPSQSQTTIASIPWRVCFTTNYDNTLERASESNSVLMHALTRSDRIEDTPRGQPFAVHLNGYVPTISEQTVESVLRLTTESYLTYDLTDSEWLALFRDYLRTSRAVFFIGYSLYDLDIRRVLWEDPKLKLKTFFINDEHLNADARMTMSKFGTLDLMGMDRFAGQITSIKSTYIQNPIEEF